MQENRSTTEQLPSVEQLKSFYSVNTEADLIISQYLHIVRLQKKLATKDSFTKTFGVPRIG